MRTVCEKNKCTGCMACVETCPKNAIKIQDKVSFYNAVIENKCIDCGLCNKVCPQNNTPELIKPKAWNQGWTNDDKIRFNSSSGGIATALSLCFIEKGGIVYSCCFENGKFVFSKATSKEDIKKFAGSKYVKSNPKGVYSAVKNDISKGTKVLFIGLPCQVGALKKYTGEYNHEKLYTVDLICHGTPSPLVLEKFLNQYNRPLESMKTITFRKKTKMQIWGDDIGIVKKGVSDKYTIAFVNGLTYTENCYECKYARIERLSDLTLGDSWGNQLSPEENKKGISLVLCQTNRGEELLKNSDVKLIEVDLEQAIKKNEQLSHPSVMPKRREKFFDAIKQSKSFNKEVFKCYPKQCLKQSIKEILMTLKIIK